MDATGVRMCGLALGMAAAALIAGSEIAVAAQCGRAAWFDLDGVTASGERADSSAMTAAHRTLPFQTKVRVENLANGRSVVVRVNDRGPFTKGRVIDVSKAAAAKLDMIRTGTANVRVTVVSGKGAELVGTCGPAREPAAPEIVTASAEVGLPEPRLRPHAAITPEAAINPLADTAEKVPVTPPGDVIPVVEGARLSLRFADAFAPEAEAPKLAEPLREKADTVIVPPPIDPHHGAAPREEWDRLQQVPQ